MADTSISDLRQTIKTQTIKTEVLPRLAEGATRGRSVPSYH
jgi:hypothetical protein